MNKIFARSSCTLLLFVFFTLSGCAENYIEPNNGPTAKMRYISHKTSGIANVGVYYYEDGNCEKEYFIAALSGIALNHKRKRHGWPLGEKILNENLTEIYIKANEFHKFQFYWNFGSVYTGFTSCKITTKFKVEKDHFYEAEYFLHQNSCSVRLNEIQQDPNGEYIRTRITNAEQVVPGCKR